MIRMYHSRESRISELHREEERVDYSSPESDGEKIINAAETLDEYVDALGDALEVYTTAIAVDNEEEAWHTIRHARREVVEAWAMAQAALSKVAWVMRIDGNEAYQRMMEAMKNGEEVNMEGL